MQERRLSSNRSSRPAVDSLLAQIDEKASLNERISWLINLFYWIRHERGPTANTHLRYLFNVLDRNPGLKSNIAKTVRSIIRDINAFDLFVSTGIASQGNFIAELYDRCVARLLPKPPRLNDFAEIVHLLFPHAGDADWVVEINEENLKQVSALLHYDEAVEEQGWNSLYNDMAEAAFCLTRQIQVQSFMPAIRTRIGKSHITDLAFYHLDRVVGALLATTKTSLDDARLKFSDVVLACRQNIQSAQLHLEEAGVSVGLVYQLERIQSQLRRLETLIEIIIDEENAHRKLPVFFHDLAILSYERQSVQALLRENIALLSRKIVENNAEIGDHYITRNRSEYLKLIVMAMGGGAITCLTVVLKTNLEHLDINYFAKGFFISICYALSFVLIQVLGFTLATKQPAMTGAALASKIKNLIQSKDYSGVVEEVTLLFRSQMAAIFGNIMAVAPLIVLVEFAYSYFSERHLMTEDYARHVLKVHSVLGLTPAFAAMTGIILWLSSVCAGWVGNWFVFHELPAAIEHNTRIRRVFGWHAAKRISNYLKKNIAPLGGNVSLGFLLGMTPKAAAFFGILIDVRHVTLSTGTVALAASVLGPAGIRTPAFLLAVCGIAVAGVLNVSVSFGLALWVAGRSQRLKRAQSQVLYRRIVGEFLRRPWRFLLPIF